MTGSAATVSGAASVMPSAWPTTQPSRSAHARSTSAEHGAAATRIIRSDDRS
jgi:hypothetical protein